MKELPSDTAVCVITSAFKGVCKLWYLECRGRHLSSSTSTAQLLFEFVNERENVTTTALFVPCLANMSCYNRDKGTNTNKVSAVNSYGTLVVGDTRGGLNFYDLNFSFGVKSDEVEHNFRLYGDKSLICSSSDSIVPEVILIQNYRLGTTAIRPEPISCIKYIDFSLSRVSI